MAMTSFNIVANGAPELSGSDFSAEVEMVRADGEREAMKHPPVGTPTWTEADDAKLRSLAVAGLNAREIAAELNRSLYAVQARSKKLGLSFKQVTIRRHLKT